MSNTTVSVVATPTELDPDWLTWIQQHLHGTSYAACQKTTNIGQATQPARKPPTSDKLRSLPENHQQLHYKGHFQVGQQFSPSILFLHSF